MFRRDNYQLGHRNSLFKTLISGNPPHSKQSRKCNLQQRCSNSWSHSLKEDCQWAAKAKTGATNLVRQWQNRNTGPQSIDSRAVSIVPTCCHTSREHNEEPGNVAKDYLYIGVSRNKSAAKPRSTFFCHETNGANIMREGSTPIDAAWSLRLPIVT